MFILRESLPGYLATCRVLPLSLLAEVVWNSAIMLIIIILLFLLLLLLLFIHKKWIRGIHFSIDWRGLLFNTDAVYEFRLPGCQVWEMCSLCLLLFVLLLEKKNEIVICKSVYLSCNLDNFLLKKRKFFFFILLTYKKLLLFV